MGQVAYLGDPEGDSFREEGEGQEACLVVQVACYSYQEVVVEGVERHPYLEEEEGAEGNYQITLRQGEEEVEEADYHPFQEEVVGEEACSCLEEEGYLQAVADTADRIVI